MTSDRQHPSAAFWITVALVAVLLAYPLSFGPACWLTSRTGIGAPLVPTVYCPLIRMFSEPGSTLPNSRIGQILLSYTQLCAAKNWNWVCTDLSEGWIWTDKIYI